MEAPCIIGRPVAPTGRAAVSKTAWWGFESLLACQLFIDVAGNRDSKGAPRRAGARENAYFYDSPKLVTAERVADPKHPGGAKRSRAKGAESLLACQHSIDVADNRHSK